MTITRSNSSSGASALSSTVGNGGRSRPSSQTTPYPSDVRVGQPRAATYSSRSRRPHSGRRCEPDHPQAVDRIAPPRSGARRSALDRAIERVPRASAWGPILVRPSAPLGESSWSGIRPPLTRRCECGAECATPSAAYACRRSASGGSTRLRAASTMTRIGRLTRRKPRSTWTRLNRQRVADMEAAGLMTNAERRRRRMLREATAGGRSSIPSRISGSLTTSPQHSTPTRRHGTHGHVPPSARKAMLWWVISAASEHKSAQDRDDRGQSLNGERAQG